jgi:hypothetical protein
VNDNSIKQWNDDYLSRGKLKGHVSENLPSDLEKIILLIYCNNNIALNNEMMIENFKIIININNEEV